MTAHNIVDRTMDLQFVQVNNLTNIQVFTDRQVWPNLSYTIQADQVKVILISTVTYQVPFYHWNEYYHALKLE